MKKRFTILAAAFALLAFLAIPMGMRGQTRDVETFTFSELGFGNAEDVTVVEGDDITLTFAQGTNANNAPKYYTTGTAVRMYTGNTLEVALNNQEGETRITAIDFTFVSNSYAGSLQNWTGSETSVSFTNTASSQARIQVIAVTFSEGGTPTPTTYTVTYDCNGGTSGCPENVTGIEAGTQIQLAAAPTKTDYSFDGWSDGSTTYQAGANYTVNGNVTMTAQWTEIVSGDEQWVLTNLADLTASDVFVIVSTKGTANYAMSNDKGASAAPTAVSVTVANDQITSNVASTIQWTGITGNATDGYTIYSNADNTKYLYCINNNNGVRVGSGVDNTFIIKDNYIYNNGQGRYIGVYNNADWRCYTTIHANIQGQTFAFYKKVTDGVIPPSITAANVDIAYNATSGSIAYTINNGVTGGTMSVATESDWLTLGQGTTSPISFTCSANSAGTDRTATVTLTYTYNRATVTANVIVTQAGNPDATMTIAEVRAQGTGNVATLGTVTSITGTSNKTAYIQDATAAIVVYGNFTAAVGDEIRVSGTLSDYNGLLEITDPVATVVSSGNTINPELMTIAEINVSANQGWYIRVENATVTAISGQNTTIAQGDNTIVVRGISGVEYVVNDVLSLNGNIGYYNGNQIANPQNIEVQQNTEPSINISNATINVPAEGAEGTIAVVYQNIEEMVANVYFCNAEGAAASYDWIYAEVDDDNNLYYSINPNDGEARTAYLKVYEGNTNTYSNLVTINQAAYVAPTYAELPFEYNDGLDGIEETDGLYQDGIGSDYNTNNTKLRFDNTGDWLLLQFNERPGTLTFDIKGNTFSGGTFNVQTSEDGETYTDLATYTELGATQSEEFPNLGENVRYIKWIYTNKVSGNVGLGNIVLNEYTEPVPAIILDTYAIDVPAEGNEGNINVTYQNFDFYAEDLFVYFCDENDSEATYDWITVEFDANNNVHYVVEANQSEARTAYFRVCHSAPEDVETDLKSLRDPLIATAYFSDMVTVTQAAYVAPFEPATYTLVTNIEQLEIGTSNKTYIIVGKKTIDGVDSYYAMGEQRSKNRGGVAISVNGTTATVETAEVHEFLISGAAWVGPDFDFNNEDQGVDYSIYDTNEASQGFLYAASSTDNVLKTDAEPDENANWDITIDENGQFSIVARGSNTHNVMQFNYNGGNTLFSCYASASQLPVYLYVKEEATTTVTQTITLAQGINWVSFYVETDMDALKEALVEALPGANSITIKSQKNGQTAYNGSRWRGALSTLDLALMYQITVPEGCEFTLEAMPLDPAQHPITIKNGPNWIGFPFNEAMTPTEAFAGLPPVSGDVLKSKTQQTNYSTRWRGALSSLVPGQGYIYNSAETGDKTFVYPTNTNKTVLKIVK